GFTGTVINPTTTPTLSLILQNASTSQSGQLTSADWTTFNNKLDTSRNITINSLTQDLTVDRTWTITTTGTPNRITITGGAGIAPTVDISATYIGQTSITTIGTITTGTWNGTAIANANLANSVITIAGTSTSLGGSITQDTITGLSSTG